MDRGGGPLLESVVGSRTNLGGLKQTRASRQTFVETSPRVAKRRSKMALKQLQLVIRGRVQGVYFRASAQREARRLGLVGLVRNRPDGSVEIVAEGEESSIRELHGWAQKGPSVARVDRVDTRWRSYSGEYSDFRIVE